MLIILRGNSGSGKTTTAQKLRDQIIAYHPEKKVAIVEQDYLRRKILKEKESEGSDNVELIRLTSLFALRHNYVVIIEGILYSERYKSMLLELIDASTQYRAYYLNIPLEETLVRHQSKPNADEFGEAEMRSWYREKDLLHLDNEIILDQNLSQDQVVKTILADINL